MYSIPSIIEGEFRNAFDRVSSLDAGLGEVNRAVTSLAQSTVEQHSAVHSRMSAVEKVTFDLQTEINNLHTQSSDQLDRIAELEAQLEEQALLIRNMDARHQEHGCSSSRIVSSP